MEVFIISPTEKGGRLWEPSDELASQCKPYSAIEMNDRWLLTQPEVHTLSCGAHTPEQVDQHLGAFEASLDLNGQDEAVFVRLDRSRQEIDHFCTECQKCLPCPEDIRIPEILRMRNGIKAFQMADNFRERYNQITPGDRWFGGAFGNACTDCGDCLPRCPEKLPIPDLLRESHNILYRPPEPTE